MYSGGVNVIRKITRGTSSGKGDVTISCSITDTNKVIVLLDADISYYKDSSIGLSGCSIYLKSVSNTNIIVNAKGPTNSSSNSYSTREITFSYQIIELI